MSSIARQSEVAGWGRSFSSKIAAAQSWPANWVAAGGALLFIAAFTIHGAIVRSGAALHFDVLEAYAWGKEFQLGYDKHPPFWAWIAGAWFMLFPVNNASFMLLQAINSTLGLWGAWKLNGLFAKGWTRHAATLLLVATPLYTVMAFKYNANTILISLWPWTLFFFVRSLDGMRMRDALLFGAFAAACILSKYYAAILLMTCGLSLFFHPNGRKYFLSPLPWLAAVVFTALVLPHVLWVLANDAPTVAYAMNETGQGWPVAIQYAARFILDSAVSFGGVLAILFLAWWTSKASIANEPAARLPQSPQRFLAVLALTPPLLTIVFGLGFQLRPQAIWAVGIFSLMPLLLMQFAPALDSRRCFQLAAAVAVAITFGAVPEALIERAVKKAKPSAALPVRELAATATALWHAQTHAPLRYAGGHRHFANGISFYSGDHPSSFMDLSYAASPWVTPEKIRKDGLLIACLHEDSNCLGKAAGLLSWNWKQTSINVGRAWGSIRAPEVAFDVFVVPPQQR
ncbi:MAG: glycosyltransferase family 39 protein [Rhodomicrobium sp.]